MTTRDVEPRVAGGVSGAAGVLPEVGADREAGRQDVIHLQLYRACG